MKLILFVAVSLLAGLFTGCATNQSAINDATTGADSSVSIPLSVTLTATLRSTPTTFLTPTTATTLRATQISAQISATTAFSAGTANRNAEAEAAYGLQIYREQYCGVCHQLSAAKTAGTFGPPQDGIGETAQQRIQDSGYTGDATTAVEYVLESLTNPQIYIVPGYELTSHQMPAYTHLDEQKLSALVQWLQAQ